MSDGKTKITLGKIAAWMNEKAPNRLAESWDNVGLQIGDPGLEASGVLTVLECDRDVVIEAAEAGCNVIVSHHPLIFRPLKNLNPTQYQPAAIAEIIKRDMGFICAHTNLDKAPWGTNPVMAERLGLTNTRYLHPEPSENLRKLVVFVPEGHEAAVLDAIDAAGGGKIGRYGKCSFRTPGTGTFQGDASTNPAIGAAGEFEEVQEYRLETIVPAEKTEAVVAAMNAAHPYEEVAYDLYPTDRRGETLWGLGLVGEINVDDKLHASQKDEYTLGDFAKLAGRQFEMNGVQVVGDLNATVKKVAVSSGAGNHSISSLRANPPFDVLVTGEITYHAAAEARHKGINTICVGHFASETFIAERMAEELQESFSGIKAVVSKSATDPLVFVSTPDE